jgi:hypothetical protein
MTADEKDLVNQIHHAFAGVRLEDGTSLNMTEYIDSAGCVPEFMEKAKTDERDDWTAIPDKTLEEFTGTFSFTDLKGFRFYIPAYMSWTLKNHHKCDSIIGDWTIYAIDPNHYLFESTPFWQWFTTEQIDTMIKFLEFAIRNPDSLDDTVAKANLRRIKRAQKGGA